MNVVGLEHSSARAGEEAMKSYTLQVTTVLRCEERLEGGPPPRRRVPGRRCAEHPLSGSPSLHAIPAWEPELGQLIF
jgi:hypothetical protein